MHFRSGLDVVEKRREEKRRPLPFSIRFTDLFNSYLLHSSLLNIVER
jgi:hypothetical protein